MSDNGRSGIQDPTLLPNVIRREPSYGDNNSSSSKKFNLLVPFTEPADLLLCP